MRQTVCERGAVRSRADRFPRVGTLEAFNTDACVRFWSRHQPIDEGEDPSYPGHVDGCACCARQDPSAQTSRGGWNRRRAGASGPNSSLFALWRRLPDEEELTVLRVVVEGLKRPEPPDSRLIFSTALDPATGTTSMARTTGFPLRHRGPAASHEVSCVIPAYFLWSCWLATKGSFRESSRNWAGGASI